MGGGGLDGAIEVSDQPIWLEDNEIGLDTARALTLGEAANWLPTIYISAKGDMDWIFTRDEIEKLAYDLGGVAHVITEPNRAFSFRLRDKTDGRNAYGGTVGLIVPKRGIVRRHYLGWQTHDTYELAAALRLTSTNVRGQMPSIGWDWTELQEQALRAQRENYRNRLSFKESEKLYQEEIDNLQDRIQQMEEQLRNRPISESVGTDGNDFSMDNIVHRIGPEIYASEISDRLRLAANTALIAAETIGLDERSKIIFRRIVEKIPPSPALTELLEDLVRATKDPKRSGADLTNILTRHGYRKKSNNKHTRLEAENGFDGIESITIPNTPSDIRAMTNMRKQIENCMGLNKLKF